MNKPPSHFSEIEISFSIFMFLISIVLLLKYTFDDSLLSCTTMLNSPFKTFEGPKILHDFNPFCAVTLITTFAQSSLLIATLSHPKQLI